MISIVRCVMIVFACGFLGSSAAAQTESSERTESSVQTGVEQTSESPVRVGATAAGESFAPTDSASTDEPAFITVTPLEEGKYDLCCRVPQEYMHQLRGAQFLFSIEMNVEGKDIRHKQDGIVFADLVCQSKMRLRLTPPSSCVARVEFLRSGQVVRHYEMAIVVK